MKKIGIFGGTFDPVHLGHLVVAEQAREQGQLDQVWFVPNFKPPHKAATGLTPFDRRFEMLTMAIAGQEACFQVNAIEKEMAGTSYTADTLAALGQKYPNTQWHMILGADCLPDLAGWYQPQRIIAQAKLLVCARPGYTLLTQQQLADSLKVHTPELQMQLIEIPQISFASRDIRAKVSQGKSIKYLVPRSVEVYIREKKLYREPNPG